LPQQVHVIIDGRVQGVGFRYATFRRAVELGLSGWVRNLHDGRVEAEFEGPRDALDEMIEWCRRGPSFSRVTRVDETWSSSENPVHGGFRIVG
jgi:acylphosphatase